MSVTIAVTPCDQEGLVHEMLGVKASLHSLLVAVMASEYKTIRPEVEKLIAEVDEIAQKHFSGTEYSWRIP